MPSHDKQGRAYLKLADAKSGQKIICDGGFTCMDTFETARLCSHANGLYFLCANGHHYISGQADDGIHCIGIYPTLEPLP